MISSLTTPLLRGGAALVLAAIAAAAFADAKRRRSHRFTTSPTRYFGVSVPDPYRDMEDLKNPEAALG